MSHSSQLLDPAFRTVDRKPLGQRRAQLLLSCTFNDLEALVNRVNADAGHDDDDELAELTQAIDELAAIMGRYRMLRGDSDDRTMERVPVTERRHARMLQLRVDELRRQRYNPITVKQRELTAAVPALTNRLARALEEGDHAEAGRLRHLLDRATSERDALFG